MAKKKATGPKRRRKKSAAKKKKADRILTENQVRDQREKNRLGMDQVTAILAPVDFPVQGEADKQPEKPKGTSNDGRDKFIYRHAMKGVPWLRIRILLAKSKRWCDDPLAFRDGHPHISGVRAAAFRYATSHGLPKPPKRESGRRPST